MTPTKRMIPTTPITYVKQGKKINTFSSGGKFEKYYPLFDYLGNLCVRITLSQPQEFVVFDKIDGIVTDKMEKERPDLKKLYDELTAPQGGPSPWIHLPSCPRIFV